jgi:hypothetical protein
MNIMHSKQESQPAFASDEARWGVERKRPLLGKEARK